MRLRHQNTLEAFLIKPKELSENSIGKAIEFIGPSGLKRPYKILKVFKPPFDTYTYKIGGISWEYPILVEAECSMTYKIEPINEAELRFANWKINE